MVSLKNKPETLVRYREYIDQIIIDYLPHFSEKNFLRDACEYALSTGGKRFRPILVLMVADALGGKSDATFAAAGIEFFHTASLVADDLPSMDDDSERRNQPSVHKKFGESIALLVSYALIASGYECIVKNVNALKAAKLPFSSQADAIGMLALDCATYNTGLRGATGGQFLDVSPPDLSLSTLKEVVHKKTSSLFEIAFVFGWLFGGGDLQKLDKVKSAASHFGLAFQIADDLGDMAQDIENGRKVNIPNVIGREEAIAMFHEEHQAFLLKLRGLGVDSPGLLQVASLLRERV